MSVNAVDRVAPAVELMRRKLVLLGDMQEISEKSLNYIDEGEVGALENFLSEKQNIIMQVDTLDELFLAEFSKIKSEYGVSSIDELKLSDSPRLAELRSYAAKILEKLKIIENSDGKLMRGVAKLREDISAELVRIRRQKHISGLYGGGASGQKTPTAQRFDGRSGFDIKR